MKLEFVRVDRGCVHLVVTRLTTTKFTAVESSFAVNLAAGSGRPVADDYAAAVVKVGGVVDPPLTPVEVNELNAVAVGEVGL